MIYDRNQSVILSRRDDTILIHKYTYRMKYKFIRDIIHCLPPGARIYRSRHLPASPCQDILSKHWSYTCVWKLMRSIYFDVEILHLFQIMMQKITKMKILKHSLVLI